MTSRPLDEVEQDGKTFWGQGNLFGALLQVLIHGVQPGGPELVFGVTEPLPLPHGQITTSDGILFYPVRAVGTNIYALGEPAGRSSETAGPRQIGNSGLPEMGGLQ